MKKSQIINFKILLILGLALIGIFALYFAFFKKYDGFRVKNYKFDFLLSGKTTSVSGQASLFDLAAESVLQGNVQYQFDSRDSKSVIAKFSNVKLVIKSGKNSESLTQELTQILNTTFVIKLDNFNHIENLDAELSKPLSEGAKLILWELLSMPFLHTANGESSDTRFDRKRDLLTSISRDSNYSNDDNKYLNITEKIIKLNPLDGFSNQYSLIVPGNQKSCKFIEAAEFKMPERCTGAESSSMAVPAIGTSESHEKFEIVESEQSAAEKISNKYFKFFNLSTSNIVGSVHVKPINPMTINDASLIMAKQTLRESDKAELLPELLKLVSETTPQKGDSEVQLVERLRAAILLDDKFAVALGEFLAENLGTHRAFRLGVHALGVAGTGAAQIELLKLISNNEAQWDILSVCVPVAAFIERPSVAIAEQIHSLSSSSHPEIRSTSVLALGQILGRMSDADGDTRNKYFDELTTQLSAGESNSEKELILGALGNSGSQKAFAAIETELQKGVESVRARAAFALRFVSGAQATELLLKALTQEKSAAVRTEAARALSFREPTELSGAAIIESIKVEKTPAVRIEVVRLLRKQVQKIRSAKSELAKIAQFDSDAEVRKLAALPL